MPLLLHPRIHTLSPALITPSNPWGTVEAMLWRDGRVVAVGPRASVEPYRRAGELVFEAPHAACVMPGLIDTHAHLTPFGQRPVVLDLPDATSPRGWADAVAAYAQTLGDSDVWITGRAWNPALWPRDPAELGPLRDDGFPTHDLLTQAAPHHPVVLHSTDNHAIWVNREAMRRAGLLGLGHVDDPHGGAVLRNAQGGLDGVFIDAATDLIERVMPAATVAELEACVRSRAARFAARGVTTVHCALVRHSERAAYRAALLGDDPAPVRVRGFLYDAPEALAEFAASNSPLANPSGRWSALTLKAFADGALGSRGAWMSAPYADAPETSGLSLASHDALRVLGRAAIAQGWQVAVHAIGDRAITTVLDAYRDAAADAQDPDAPRRLRWRIEHLQHPAPGAIARVAALGLCAAMQPVHATSDMPFCAARLGEARAARGYPWAEVAAAGIPLGLGSDYPIDTLDPFAGLHAALTRQTRDHQPPGGWHPEHALSRRQAIEGYTTTAARLVPGPDALTLGALGLGCAADWVALDQDPTDAKPDMLHTIDVLCTVVDGSVVHGLLPEHL